MPKTKTEEIYDPETKELTTVDVSDKYLEKVARGFIMGTQNFSDQTKLREKLEGAVTKKIGAKGKFLTDKLFELIEGVYIIDKRSGKDGTTIKYYKVPPSLQAITYALDRVLGKPKTVTEHTETKKGVILVEHIIKGMVTSPKRQHVEENGAGRNVLGAGEAGNDGAGSVTGNSDNTRVSETAVSE